MIPIFSHLRLIAENLRKIDILVYNIDMLEKNILQLTRDKGDNSKIVLSNNGQELTRFDGEDAVSQLIEALRQVLAVEEFATLVIQTGEQAPGIVEGIYLAFRSGALAIRRMYNLKLEREDPMEVQSWTAIPETSTLARFMILVQGVARSEGNGAVSLVLSYLFDLPEEQHPVLT